jgi:hypothetical protein
MSTTEQTVVPAAAEDDRTAGRSHGISMLIAALIIVGIQIFLSSFLLSVIGVREHR